MAGNVVYRCLCYGCCSGICRWGKLMTLAAVFGSELSVMLVCELCLDRARLSVILRPYRGREVSSYVPMPSSLVSSSLLSLVLLSCFWSSSATSRPHTLGRRLAISGEKAQHGARSAHFTLPPLQLPHAILVL